MFFVLYFSSIAFAQSSFLSIFDTNEEIKNHQKIEKMFQANGPVIGLEISLNNKYLAVQTLANIFQEPDPRTNRRINRKIEVWNIEYRIPYRKADSECSILDWVSGAAFDNKGKKIYIADYSIPRATMPQSVSGPINIREIDLENQKHFHSILPDVGYQKIRLFEGNNWFACQTIDGSWRLFSQKEHNRIVSFPDVDISQKPVFEFEKKKNKPESNKSDKNKKVTVKKPNDPTPTDTASIKNMTAPPALTPEGEKTSDASGKPIQNSATENGSEKSKENKIESDEKQPEPAVKKWIRPEIAPENCRKVVDVLAISRKGDLVATLLSGGPEINEDPFLGLSLHDNIPRTIVIWDLKVVSEVNFKNLAVPLEPVEIARFTVEDGIMPQKCVFSPNGNIIAFRSKYRYIGLRESSGGQLLCELGKHQQNIRSLAFSPNGLKLVVGTGGEKARIVLWDIRKETVQRAFQDTNPEAKNVTAVTFDHYSPIVYFGNDLGEVKSWDTTKIRKD